jgi:hypothetical protein
VEKNIEKRSLKFWNKVFEKASSRSFGLTLNFVLQQNNSWFAFFNMIFLRRIGLAFFAN